MESVKDKVVLITGGSSGIGAGAAILFAKYGSKLALTGRNKQDLDKVADECCQWGLPKENILAITADLLKNEDIARIVDETVKKFKKIDVLVNNAGIARGLTIQESDHESIDEIFQVNVKAVIHITKLAIPYLKESKGCIVNVSSVCGLKADPSMGVYCMSKAALDMFTSVLMLELGSSGIRVNAVNPGDIRTPLHGKAGVQDVEKYFKDSAKQYPCGRVGEVDEVANTIVFLASDAASFVNGVKLPVDGGVMETSSWFEQDPEAYMANTNYTNK